MTHNFCTVLVIVWAPQLAILSVYEQKNEAFVVLETLLT